MGHLLMLEDPAVSRAPGEAIAAFPGPAGRRMTRRATVRGRYRLRFLRDRPRRPARYLNPPGEPMRVSTMQTVKITLAACAAALALAACGGSSGGGGGSTSGGASGGLLPRAAARTRASQWKDDNTSTLKDFESAIKGFTSGIPTPASAKKLEDVANDAADHPLPTCADPKGLWVKAMDEVAKAAKSASKGGIEAEAEALPELEKALSDLNELQNEVKNKVDLGQI